MDMYPRKSRLSSDFFILRELYKNGEVNISYPNEQSAKDGIIRLSKLIYEVL